MSATELQGYMKQWDQQKQYNDAGLPTIYIISHIDVQYFFTIRLTENYNLIAKHWAHFT